MKLIIHGCGEAGGEVLPVPSIWSSIAVVFAAAALRSQAEVTRIDTWNPCIGDVLKLLRLLGYSVEKVSSTKIIINKSEELVKPVTTRLALNCGLLVAIPSSLFFIANSPPSSRLILSMQGAEYVSSIDLRDFREALSIIGARVWRARSTTHYLIIEKKAVSPPRLVRINTSNGALIASLLLALASLPDHASPSLIRFTTLGLDAEKRLRYAREALNSIGFNITMGPGIVRVEKKNMKKSSLSPLPGVAETLTILVYASSCRVAEISLKTQMLGEEQLKELHYLVQLVGYEVEQGNQTIKLVQANPKSVVYSARDSPELAIPLILAALRAKDSLVSGLKPSVLEGLVSQRIENAGRKIGAEVYLEENERLRVIKPLERITTRSLSCKGFDPASCSLFVYGALVSKKAVLVHEAEKAIGLIPFGLEYLQRLGVDIDIQKN